MLLVTLAKLSLLTCTAGLVGPMIFFVLVLLFEIHYASLIRFSKKKRKEAPPLNLNEDPEAIPLRQQSNDEEIMQDFETEEEEESFFFIAALCSIWVPCVVGDHSRRIYLVSGLTSLVSKVLFLAIAVGLAEAGFQHHVYKRPLLLYCFEENSPLLLEEGVQQCSFSKGDCFRNNNLNEIKYKEALEKVFQEVVAFQDVFSEISNDIPFSEPEKCSNFSRDQMYNASAFLSELRQTKTQFDEQSKWSGSVQQKVRICEDNENIFRLYLLLGLVVIIALAAFSIYTLHKIADYEVVWNIKLHLTHVVITGTIQEI